MKNVQARAVKADNAARIQLHDTWHTVVHELGLVTAMIVDTNGFLQLARLDTVSVNAFGNHTICGSGRPGKEAALYAVEGALKSGLASQTYMQLRWIFVEMLMLRDRFASEGLQEPSYETLMQIGQRASESYQGLLAQRGDLAVEVVARLCDHQLSLLETAPQDSNGMKGVLKELEAKLAADDARFNTEIAEKETLHAADQAQHAADQAKLAADDARLDTLLLVFGVVVLVVLVTLGWALWRK